MDSVQIIDGLTWYALFVFSTVCHEGAHALAAWRLGDATAYEGGQVSLDPLPHIRREPIGMVLAPLITLVSGAGMIGWASTPYDAQWAEAYPRRAAAMSLAGPLANLSLVLLAALLIHAGIALGALVPPVDADFTRTVLAATPGWHEGVAKLLSILFSLNLLLFIFNLVPVPPMDGSGALGLLLPARAARQVRDLLRRPLARFVGLLLAWNLFPLIFGPLHTAALNLLYWGANYH